MNIIMVTIYSNLRCYIDFIRDKKLVEIIRYAIISDENIRRIYHETVQYALKNECYIILCRGYHNQWTTVTMEQGCDCSICESFIRKQVIISSLMDINYMGEIQ